MRIVFIDGVELLLSGEDAGVVKNIIASGEIKKFVIIRENGKLRHLINMDNVAYISTV